MNALLFDTPQRLRHVAVVGARGHGKSALVRALASACAAVVEGGGAPSIAITSLAYKDHLVQLIDTPGSLDDIMEIYTALALADCVVLVVDPAEGVTLRVEKVIGQAITRRKPLALVLNTGEAQPSVSSSWYDTCAAAVDAVNVVISRSCSTQRPVDEWRVDPARGTVVVGSAVFGWGFPFPRSYDDEHTAAKCLGYSRHHESSAAILTSEEDTWLDAPTDYSLAESVLDTIVRHMPSPADAARFIPLDKADGNLLGAARHCDPLGPLVVHVVRLVPQRRDSDELLAIGRVLSGTVRAGQAVSVITPSKSDTMTCVALPDTALITSVRHPYGLEMDIPTGNLCVLAGVGKHINKYGVVVACESPTGILDTRLFRRLVREATPPSVLRVTIAPRNSKDTATLVTTLHQLLRVDLASELESDADEVVLAAISERHLQRCLSLLGNSGLHQEVPYTVSEPYAFFQETVTEPSSTLIVAKSPNRHIRLFCTADPLSDTVVRDWALAEYGSPDEPEFETVLTETQGWSEQSTRRLLVDPLKKGRIVHSDESQTRVRALVPTRAMWGLDEAVKAVTGEGVVIESVLDRYERVEGDPLDPLTPAGAAVRDLRIRKGSNPDIIVLHNLPVELWSRDAT